MNFEKLLS